MRHGLLALALALSPRAGAESVVGMLDEMVVVASRGEQKWIDASGTVLQVGDEELLRNGAQDLGGFAKYDPTVTLPFDFSSGDGAYAYGQSGYGSINIRGAEGNRVAIELDGIRQPPQYISTSFDQGGGDGSGGIGRDYFDPAMFDLVEVLKGGASALYGSDALGGVVSFSTPDPESFLRGKNAGGLLRGQFFSVNDSIAGQGGGAVRSGTAAAMLLWAGREGNETSNNGNEPPNPTDFSSHSGLFKIEHAAGDHLFRFDVEVFERDASTDVRSAVTSAFPVFTDYVYNDQHLERLRASLRWDYDAKSPWVDRVETHLYHQHAGSRSDSDSASLPIEILGVPVQGTERTRTQTIEFDTEITGVTAIGRRERADHVIVAGLDLSLETSENRFIREDSGAPAGENRVSFAPTDTRRAGVFIQDEISLPRKWSVTPGLRLDWQDIEPDPNQAYLDRLAALGRFGQAPPEDYENLALSPRLNIAWKPAENTQWYASYARGVRNPGAEELSMIFDHPPSDGDATGTLTVPNPDLEEERSDAFEVGFKADGDPGRFQASVFYTRYRDFIENGVSTGELDEDGRDIVTTVNRGSAEIYGFELGGSLQAGHFHTAADGWEIGASTGKVIGNDLTNDVPLNSVEPWKSIAFIGYEDPEERFGARLTGIYTAAVTRVDDSTSQGEFFRPPSWFTLDLGVWWKPDENLTIHAGLNNIFDEQYWAWGSVRRGNGHLGGNASTDRSTAPGRNFSISLTKTF